MANIRIKDLPADGAPKQTDLIPIDLGSTRHATVKAIVESGRPTASKAEAEVGVEPQKAMTPLTTKQAIDAQVGASYVPKTVNVVAGSGLSGGGELSGDVTVGLTATNIDRLNKVDGIAVGATANQTDAYLLNRDNHTGTQAIGTVSGLQSALDSKATAAQGDKADSAVQSVNGKSGNSVTITAEDVGAVPDTFIDDIDDNTLARHTHSNKAILDATTASFLASEKSKLSGIEAGAQVNTVTSVSGKTGAVTLVKADVGLGNVDNTSDASKPVSTATQTALNAKANSSVTVSAGAGLTGGGNLTANRSIALSAASTASLGKADTALQAPGGTTGQVLAKSSAADNDVAWVSSEAATAVSYAPQTLTDAQKSQARANIDADKVYNTKASAEAANIPSSLNAIRLNGYYAAGDGGGALYKRVATEPTHAGKIQSADGAWWELSEQKINVRMFGAKGDGTTDDTSSINTAYQACLAKNSPLYFDEGKYLVSESGAETASGKKRCIFNPGVSTYGTGPLSSIIIPSTSLSNDVDFIHLIPTAGKPQDFLAFDGIGVWPSYPSFDTDVKGRDVLWLQANNSGINITKLSISGCYFLPSNGYSFISEANPATVFQGAPANSLIAGNAFWGGVKCSNLGDSNVFERNVVRSPVSHKAAFDIHVVAASGGIAGHNVFSYNNIDCYDGAFYFHNGREIIIDGNNIECSDGGGSSSQAIIDLDGLSGTITDAKITNNHIGIFGTSTAETAIRINSSDGCELQGNTIMTDVARSNGIFMNSNAVNTKLISASIKGPWTSPVLNLSTTTLQVKYENMP